MAIGSNPRPGFPAHNPRKRRRKPHTTWHLDEVYLKIDTKVDVLGFSIGGMVAQEITAQAPDLVRRLILVGTGPRGADMSTSRSAEIFAVYDPPERLWLAVHFSPSPSGRAAGLAFPRSASFSARIAIPR